MMVIVGRGESLTVTVKVQVFVLLAASVATHVTVVTPMANVEPEAGVQTTGTKAVQLSVAVAVKFTTAPLLLVQAAV
jgi:hypothetical protein